MHVFYHKLVNASCTYLASIIPEDRLWLRLYRKRPYLQMSHHCGHPLLLHPLQRVRERERRGRRWWRNLDNLKRFITMHVSKTEQGTPEHVYQWCAVARNFLYKACDRFKPAERSHKRPTCNGCLKCIETELRKYMQFSFLSVWALLCKWNLKYVTTLPPPPPPPPQPTASRIPNHKTCSTKMAPSQKLWEKMRSTPTTTTLYGCKQKLEKTAWVITGVADPGACDRREKKKRGIIAWHRNVESYTSSTASLA